MFSQKKNLFHNLLQGVYFLDKGIIDLGTISKLPIAGNNWVNALHLYRNNRMTGKRTLLFCTKVSSSAIRSRRKTRKAIKEE